MATNTKVLKAILLVVAAMALPSIGSAQNENGVLQYIDVIPPDYCFLLIAPTAKCPTTMAAEADKGVRVGPEEGEIARHDRMLLETYLSVDDIEDLRDRRLELIESQIKLAEVYLDNLRKKLVGLQSEASNYKPYSTREDAPPIPEDLARDISQTEASIYSWEQTLARRRADQAALKKSFDADIARFIEIKGG